MAQRQFRPDQGLIRRQAAELVGASGQRMSLVFSLLLALSPAGLYVLLGQSFSLLFESTQGQAPWILSLEEFVYAILLIALSVYVTLPMIKGLVRQGRAVARGEEVEVSDVFFSFSSAARYRDSIRMSFPGVIRICLWGGVISLTYETAAYFSASRAVVLVGSLLIVAEGAVALLFLLRSFPVLFFYLYDDRMSPTDARRRARERCRTDYGAYVAFWLGYLPHLLLGLLTLGVLLITHVLPHMTVAYHLLCREAEERHAAQEEVEAPEEKEPYDMEGEENHE